MGLIKAQAAARVGVAGSSFPRAGGRPINPAALKGAPASAALLCACSAVLIYAHHRKCDLPTYTAVGKNNVECGIIMEDLLPSVKYSTLW